MYIDKISFQNFKKQVENERLDQTRKPQMEPLLKFSQKVEVASMHQTVLFEISSQLNFDHMEQLVDNRDGTTPHIGYLAICAGTVKCKRWN